MTRTEAIKLRAKIEQAAISLSDSDASTAALLFPRLKGDGALVPAGTRINHNGAIKRAAVDLWDTAANNPDQAPTLWDDIGYQDGFRIIPDVITAGTAFAQGECGWWEGVLYRSIIDNNVWTPLAYPAGWEKHDNTT